MWDERFSSDEYAYGKDPNRFLVEQAGVIPMGQVLSLAEGEGRNAVYLAGLGYRVTAMDGSAVGLEKARRLAVERQVVLETVQDDLARFDPGVACWEGILSIFVPLDRLTRTRLHRRVVEALKPGGVYVIEAYTPRQLAFGTGGGTDPDTKVTADMLREELEGLQFLLLQEVEREVLEGRFHTGRSAVVQAVAMRPAGPV